MLKPGSYFMRMLMRMNFSKWKLGRTHTNRLRSWNGSISKCFCNTLTYLYPNKSLAFITTCTILLLDLVLSCLTILYPMYIRLICCALHRSQSVLVTSFCVYIILFPCQTPSCINLNTQQNKRKPPNIRLVKPNRRQTFAPPPHKKSLEIVPC